MKLLDVGGALLEEELVKRRIWGDVGVAMSLVVKGRGEEGVYCLGEELSLIHI